MQVVAVNRHLTRAICGLEHRETPLHIVVQLAQILLNLERLLKDLLLFGLRSVRLSKDLLVGKVMVRCTQIVVFVKLAFNLIQMVQNPVLLLVHINQLSQVRFLGLGNLQGLRFELFERRQSFDKLHFLFPHGLDSLIELLLVGLHRADPLFSDEFKRLAKEVLFLLLFGFQSIGHLVQFRLPCAFSGFGLFLLRRCGLGWFGLAAKHARSRCRVCGRCTEGCGVWLLFLLCWSSLGLEKWVGWLSLVCWFLLSEGRACCWYWISIAAKEWILCLSLFWSLGSFCLWLLSLATEKTGGSLYSLHLSKQRDYLLPSFHQHFTALERRLLELGRLINCLNCFKAQQWILRMRVFGLPAVWLACLAFGSWGLMMDSWMRLQLVCL